MIQNKLIKFLNINEEGSELGKTQFNMNSGHVR
jgi:hypothetical protein